MTKLGNWSIDVCWCVKEEHELTEYFYASVLYIIIYLIYIFHFV